MEKIYKCPNCEETKQLKYEYDYTKQHRPIKSVHCIQCGEVFDGDMPVAELYARYELGKGYTHYLTKPGFVERRMKLGHEHNTKAWNKIYEEYKGVSDLHDFVEWLIENYQAPTERLWNGPGGPTNTI